jgi:hypothetical protein
LVNLYRDGAAGLVPDPRLAQRYEARAAELGL